MMDAKQIKSMAARLEKAEELAASGAVFPVAGLSGYSVVRNGSGDSMYLVRHDAGHENCTCPDFKERQGKVGQPCKHLLACQIVAGGTPPPAPSAVAVVEEPQSAPDVIAQGVALLMGKVAA